MKIDVANGMSDMPAPIASSRSFKSRASTGSKTSLAAKSIGISESRIAGTFASQ